MHPKQWRRHIASWALPFLRWMILTYPAAAESLGVTEIRILSRLIAAYTPAKYVGRTTLIVSEVRAQGSANPDFGFRAFASDVDVGVIPCDHDKWMEEPQIRLLAEELKHLVDDAYARLGVDQRDSD